LFLTSFGHVIISAGLVNRNGFFCCIIIKSFATLERNALREKSKKSH
jgi:hypothetical protein